MVYVGLQAQIRRNNFYSGLILLLFPIVIIGLTWLFFFLKVQFIDSGEYYSTREISRDFLRFIPWVFAVVTVWFFAAWLFHTSIIEKATASIPLERKDNMRVFNLTENLCISRGMTTPKIYIIQDNSLNAFAFGINKNTYSISLSKGMIDKLNDQELEAVIAHELTHIRNRDVRLLIISIIFVGIFTFVAQASFRMLRHNRKGKKGGGIILIFLAVGILGLICSILMRFGLSRKREYLADAGAVELTKNPLALASALKKISSDSRIEAIERKDIAQLCIENPHEKEGSMGIGGIYDSVFSTHPPIQERIRLLEQF